MKEEIESYFGRLESLSTLELERSAQKVVDTEKRNVARVIAHIAEISKRKAHIELGYKTLFDYCVRGLGLSEGSAWSRIRPRAPRPGKGESFGSGAPFPEAHRRERGETYCESRKENGRGL